MKSCKSLIVLMDIKYREHNRVLGSGRSKLSEEFGVTRIGEDDREIHRGDRQVIQATRHGTQLVIKRSKIAVVWNLLDGTGILICLYLLHFCRIFNNWDRLEQLLKTVDGRSEEVVVANCAELEF